MKRRLLDSTADSVARLAADNISAKGGLDPSLTTPKLNALTRPGSVASTMKKVGIALIATPDPITGAVGVPLLASSYVMKKKEPATLANLAEETRKVLRDMESLSL